MPSNKALTGCLACWTFGQLNRPVGKSRLKQTDYIKLLNNWYYYSRWTRPFKLLNPPYQPACNKRETERNTSWRDLPGGPFSHTGENWQMVLNIFSWGCLCEQPKSLCQMTLSRRSEAKLPRNSSPPLLLVCVMPVKKSRSVCSKNPVMKRSRVIQTIASFVQKKWHTM